MNSYDLKSQAKTFKSSASLPSQSHPKHLPSTRSPTSIFQSENGETDETSGEFQSMVVMDDFDVEKELSKAEKEGSNAFAVLSMCFYERTKARINANKQTMPAQKPQEYLSTAKLASAKPATPQQSYSKIMQRDRAKVQPKVISDIQISNHVVPNKNQHSPKENSKKIQSPKSQAPVQKVLKIASLTNCWMPNDQQKSPKANLEKREVQSTKNYVPLNRDINTPRPENDSANYYFSILKQKYCSSQARPTTGSYQSSFGALGTSIQKPAREETRPSIANSSKEIKTPNGAPLIRLFDLKERVKQIRENKTVKETTGSKSARNGAKNDIYAHFLQKSKEKNQGESPRVKTERTFEVSRQVFTEPQEEDFCLSTKMPVYEKARKIVEKNKIEEAKRKLLKEKSKGPLSARLLNSQTRTFENLRSPSAMGDAMERDCEAHMIQTSRSGNGEKIRTNFQDENSKLGNHSLFGKSSECIRLSVDPVDRPQFKGSSTTKAAFKLNMDPVWKDRCETEPNTISLREFWGQYQREVNPTRTERREDKKTVGK